MKLKKVWEDPVLSHYTRHGMKHSKSVIKKLGQILELNPTLLNKHERFVLLAATYLHDIGMQNPGQAGLPEKDHYTICELEQVRENHHQASTEMITKSIEENDNSLGLEGSICRNYVSFTACVCKYHTKN